VNRSLCGIRPLSQKLSLRQIMTSVLTFLILQGKYLTIWFQHKSVDKSTKQGQSSNFVGYFVALPAPRLYTIELHNDEWMSSRKGFGRKRSQYSEGAIFTISCRNRGKWRKASARVSDIRTEDLLNTSTECCSYMDPPYRQFHSRSTLIMWEGSVGHLSTWLCPYTWWREQTRVLELCEDTR
jgi:hypothetical protein